LLHDEYINYLKRENQSKYEEYKNYYIKRKLKRFIQIDRKIMDDKEETFLIVNSEDEFKEKCSTEKKSIHYLLPISDSSNFEWKKSKGLISDLNKYIIKGEEVCVSFDEENIFNHKEDILLISAEPGMGKSTILDKLVFDSTSNMFYLKIELNSLIEILEALKEQKIKHKDDNDVLELILRNLLQKENLEISILNKLASEMRLILMFDGLDEVNDYKEEVKKLIKRLSVKHESMKIILTTRSHLREELEDYFETISFNLNNFEKEDQQSFLYNYWRGLNLKRQKNFKHSDLEHSAQVLINKVTSSLNQRLSDLIGIPLQTKMMADIFFDNLGTNDLFETELIANIADLYKKFVEKKLVIGYEEKRHHAIINNRGLFQRERKTFYDDHIQLSTIYFFTKTKIQIQMEKDEIQAYGLIVEFRNEIPIFLHQSFAEYFLALSAVEKIKQSQDVKEILRNKEFFLVRHFLDEIFPKETIINSNKNSANFKEEIENCCKENLPNIMAYLIVTKNADIKTENEFLLTASIEGHKEIVQLLIEKGIDINQTETFFKRNSLHFASQYGYKEIAQFLIEKGIDINKTDELDKNALNWASEGGHKELVQLLLEKGFNINSSKANGPNALHLALRQGNKEVAKFLIENGADINQIDDYGQNALHSACEGGDIKVVQLLIEKGFDLNQTDEDGNNALHLASEYGHREVVQLLIENGIDINQKDSKGQNALHLASREGHKEIVQFLVEKGFDINQTKSYGHNALHLASKEGHKEIVELLIEKGIDINQTVMHGLNAFHLASKYGHKEIVQLFIDKGIDIHKTDTIRRNALLLASELGHKEIIQLLIEKGLDINNTDEDGMNILHMASKEGHKEFAQLLIEKGVNINLTDKDGWNALHYASLHGHTDIVEILIEKGIDINQIDKDKKTAWHLASEKGHDKIVQLLIKKGIDTKQTSRIGRYALHLANPRLPQNAPAKNGRGGATQRGGRGKAAKKE
jgi:ankyrin repeat protein